MDSRGFQRVKIIAADLLPSAAWSIVDDLLRDPELFHAVDVVGLVKFSHVGSVMNNVYSFIVFFIENMF